MWQRLTIIATAEAPCLCREPMRRHRCTYAYDTPVQRRAKPVVRSSIACLSLTKSATSLAPRWA